MFIREITLDDASDFVTLVKLVEKESEFMLFGAGERKITPEQQLNRIEIMKKQENSTIFVAENDLSVLVGYMVVIGGFANKSKHSVSLAVGVLRQYSGQGIGTMIGQLLYIRKWDSKLKEQRGIHFF
ncbi:hypothetical protein ASG93_13860 [Paenibacillus sp. Soil787]|nr:hypothetical protein [Paenibacillus sp. Soil787]KRF13598.1 hypothetical protein ASG93_13860 [Paenibacillus sp. Soil787]